MRIGVSIQQIGGLMVNEAQVEKNLRSAEMKTAHEVAEFLREETKGPKSQQVAQCAADWKVDDGPEGVGTVNDNPVASFLEYGVGVFNEGPGSKEPIRPVRANVLTWVDENGVRHYAKKVQGFKGTAMVRNNLDHFADVLEQHAAAAFGAAAQGMDYA